MEETGNFMLMIVAVSNQLNKTVDFIPERYWPLLDGWAQYLWSTAYDPGNQVSGARPVVCMRADG